MIKARVPKPPLVRLDAHKTPHFIEFCFIAPLYNHLYFIWIFYVFKIILVN